MTVKELIDKLNLCPPDLKVQMGKIKEDFNVQETIHGCAFIQNDKNESVVLIYT